MDSRDFPEISTIDDDAMTITFLSDSLPPKRPSFIVKRVNEDDLQQENDQPIKRKVNQLLHAPLTPADDGDIKEDGLVNEATNLFHLSSAATTTTFSPSSSSSSSDSSLPFTYPKYTPLYRKQSIRHSCRLHSHHHRGYLHNHDNFKCISNNNNCGESERKVSIKRCLVSPYYIWKKRFMDSHECDQKDFVITVILSMIPNILKLCVGIAYIVLGAALFQEIDPSLAKESFPELLLFTFTSVTTIGYGNLVPTSKPGIIFCIFYICFGVPTVFLVLSNFSEMVAEFYWIAIAVFKCEKELETDHPHQLPVYIAMLLILGHSALGSILFSYLMPELDYIDTFYFSFVSISTIGFGDISPKPQSITEAAIIIAYLSIGIIILSAFIGSLTVLIRRIHYIGRSFEGAEHVQVYFGGSKFTVAELLEIVSAQFNVTSSQLREVIQELDELINIAVEEPKSEPLKGPRGEDIIVPIKENRQSISISVTSKQTNYTSRFSDVEQVRLIQAVGTMCHLSQSGKKSFRSATPSIIRYSRTISNPPFHHPSLVNAFKTRSLSNENLH